MPQVSGILTIACSDRPGLIAGITAFLAKHGANILDANQHSDLEAGAFFMRMEFSLDGMTLAREEITRAFIPIAEEFSLDWSLHFSDEIKNMAILVSQQDHCLYDLLLRYRANEFRVNIPLIISNHPTLASVAQNFGIEWRCLPVTAATKREQEGAIIELLKEKQIDVVVLARYMQVLSAEFVEEYRWRIINIHHSLLPAFAGAKPYHKAYEYSVKIIGATSHYVTKDLDDGPIIAQDIARVSHRDSVEDLIRRGRDVERLVLAQAVKAHLEDRVLVYGRRAIVFT